MSCALVTGVQTCAPPIFQIRGVPMSVVPLRTEARSRGFRMLRTALGVSDAGWLDDPATIEVMLNPDGRLWIDRLGEGVSDTGERMAAADGERVIRLVAHHVGVDVHADMPRVSAELHRSEEHTSELQSLMRISYAVFC